MPDSLQRILAALCAVLTLPLVVGFALLVRLDSPGPALYVAPRMGEGGRPGLSPNPPKFRLTGGYQGRNGHLAG